MKFDRKGWIMMIFACTSTLSTVYVSVATVNYVGFYPALGQLDANVTSVSFSAPSSNMSKMAFDIIVSNPTGYVGFNVVDADVSFSFSAGNSPNSTLFVGASSLSGRVSLGRASLGPHSQMAIVLYVPLSSENATSLSNFSNANNHAIVVHTNLVVEVDTFLVPVVGRTTVPNPPKTIDSPLLFE